MNGPPQIGGYSFYLNVVVINTNSTTTTTKDEETADGQEPPSSADETCEQIPEEPVVENTENTDNNNKSEDEDRDIIPVSAVRTEDPKLKLLVESKALVDFAFGRVRGTSMLRRDSGGGSSAFKNKDGRGFISSLGSSISKSSSNISKRASRFVASKTMVSRAEKAVVECIPLVTEEIGVEMSISKRFQQGPVFVLEVDMKGCELLELLRKVEGDEAADHYANVKAGLEFLDLPDAQEAFVKEVLPKLRKAMMEKMSDIVPEKMKLKKAYADLEIQCVALEDAEEAKWLYNFLAFMEEMK